jgi:hypothetical protein
LWSEQVDDVTVSSVFWPRAAALGELVWSVGGAPGATVAAVVEVHSAVGVALHVVAGVVGDIAASLLPKRNTLSAPRLLCGRSRSTM